MELVKVEMELLRLCLAVALLMRVAGVVLKVVHQVVLVAQVVVEQVVLVPQIQMQAVLLEL